MIRPNLEIQLFPQGPRLICHEQISRMVRLLMRGTSTYRRHGAWGNYPGRVFTIQPLSLLFFTSAPQSAKERECCNIGFIAWEGWPLIGVIFIMTIAIGSFQPTTSHRESIYLSNLVNHAHDSVSCIQSTPSALHVLRDPKLFATSSRNKTSHPWQVIPAEISYLAWS